MASTTHVLEIVRPLGNYSPSLWGDMFNSFTWDNEDEKQKGQVHCGVEFYMKQYGVSKEEAFNKLREFVEDAWKDINEDCVRTSAIPVDILIRALNQARVIDVAYKNDQDGYTHSEILKPHIISLVVDPITL